MRHARLAVILLLAFVLSTAPVLMPPRAPGVGATVATAAQDPSAVEAALGLDRPTRRLIQQGLRNEDFDAGEPDGLFGRRTRGAIRPWQEARGVLATGYLDGEQAELLRAAGGPPLSGSNERPPAAVVEVAVSPGRGGDRDAAARGDRTWTGASSCPRLDRSVATGYGKHRMRRHRRDAKPGTVASSSRQRRSKRWPPALMWGRTWRRGMTTAARPCTGRPSTARILQPYKRSSPLVAMWRHLTVTGSRFILPLPLGV